MLGHISTGEEPVTRAEFLEACVVECQCVDGPDDAIRDRGPEPDQYGVPVWATFEWKTEWAPVGQDLKHDSVEGEGSDDEGWPFRTGTVVGGWTLDEFGNWLTWDGV